jgi:gluconokinase
MVIIVMGVSGSGKTTIGRLLAQRLGWSFIDGDEHHPAENTEKMSRGEPLTDADRQSWLASLRCLIDEHLQRGESAVLACSALKDAYRIELGQGDPSIAFVYLRGEYPAILERLVRRKRHFMKANLLASQFRDLEEPSRAVVVDVDKPPERLVDDIIASLALRSADKGAGP